MKQKTAYDETSLAMRNTDVPAVLRLLRHARYEVLPTARIEDQILESVPTPRRITVTASPTKGLGPTLDLTESLAKAGYDTVPHLAARMVQDKAELQDIVARLQEAGVSAIFVPAGDAQEPASYPDSLTLLRDLAELGSPFAHVGVAGYPESHPTIHDDLLIQAMWEKRTLATHIVSNLSFDAVVVGEWIQRLRRRGLTNPVLVGLPGPVERTKLLAMATRIGVGDSTRFLAKNRGLMARLAAPGGFTGQRFLEQLAPVAAQDDARVEGLHLYTFNQVAQTQTWLDDLITTLDRA